MGYAGSETSLDHLERLPLPAFKTPKVLGVDDERLPEGDNYGTILVDLETHQPIAILADRKQKFGPAAETHPGIEYSSVTAPKPIKRDD